MPIYTEWYDTDKTILLTNFHDAWTWREFEAHERTVVLPLCHNVNIQLGRVLDLRQSHWLQPMQFKDQIKNTINTLSEFDIACMCFVVGDISTGALLEATFKQFDSRGYCYYKAVNSPQAAFTQIQECLRESNSIQVSA